jgi:hypothetical protein
MRGTTTRKKSAFRYLRFIHGENLVAVLVLFEETANRAGCIVALRTEYRPGVRIGLIYTVHTFGRDLGFTRAPGTHLPWT